MGDPVMSWGIFRSRIRRTVNGPGADEVYDALDRSLLTIRLAADKLRKRGLNAINAFGLYLSSPSAANDKIMTLAETLRTSKHGMAVHLASWEMSPDIDRDSSIIVDAFDADPVAAARDYGAKPPLSSSPYISDVSAYESIFSKRPNMLQYSYRTVRRGQGASRRYAVCTPGTIRSPSILTLDAGETQDSFALAVGSIRKGRPYISGLMEVVPDNYSIDFAEMFHQAIEPIIVANNVVRVFADRWQSTKILHDVERYGEKIRQPIVSDKMSMKKEDMDLVTSYISDPDNRPIIPELERPFDKVAVLRPNQYPQCFKYQPVSHLLFQMATVRKGLRNIEKGEGYTDDIFRAVWLLLHRLYDKEERKFLADITYSPIRGAVMAHGTYTSRTRSRSRVGIGAVASRRAVRHTGGVRRRLRGRRR